MSRELDHFRRLFGDRWCLDWHDAEPIGQVCTLAPGHEGDHEARHVGLGELFGTWPREAP